MRIQKGAKTMIDPGLEGKVALVTGANNPFGIGAAIAHSLASHGARLFLHYFRQGEDLREMLRQPDQATEEGFGFYLEQQAKTADEVLASIRGSGGEAESWEGDLRDPENAGRLFTHAEEAYGQVDILVNNAAEYLADTFLPSTVTGEGATVYDEGPSLRTIDADSHDRHFAVNCRAVVDLTATFARRIIERQTHGGRVVNISADCAWGCPREISYRASKYALESYSRSAAAELGPFGITVNVVSPGPVQSGYIDSEAEGNLVAEIPMRRVGRPEDIANAVLFFASDHADWVTGQVLFVHGGHRIALGR
jgi:3-oxoacyl-[acyl-carrier protein] reductase